MALDFTLVLRAETAAAKAELEAAARGIQGVTTSTDKSTVATRANATARQAAAQANRAYSATTNQAAGATGNLVAQLNDVGMMLAAGQNPLQLAIQQGTQITQVIGPMGAGGAVRALGTAFMSMLNPLNLITLGVIAASGVMIQWLTSASEDTSAAAAEMEKLQAAIEGVAAETEKLRLEREMMLSGAASTDEQRILNENIRLLAERAAIEKELAERPGDTGMTGVSALQEALEARREEINLQIATNNEILAGAEAERERKAETGETLDLAGKVQAATAGITSALQAADGSRLNAAFASAFPLANQLLGLAQGIVATIGQAQSFQSAQTGELAAQYAQYGAGRTIGERLAKESGPLYGGKSVLPAVRVPGGGGGGGAARDEADALQELISSLEGEINALRTANPIQQEMLRHREALAGATDAERKKVEELIATREREKNVTEGLQNAAQMGGNALIDALMGADNAGQRLIETLLQAGLQAALLGEGPLAGLFGGGDSGGFVGMLLSAVSPKKLAGGGAVAGPGTATSDSIPAMLSDGEFVVNAKATARNRALLEAINAGGRVAAFANGGMVGGGRSFAPGGGGQRPMVNIINQSSEPIREEQGSGPDAEGTVTLIVGRAMNQGRFDRQQRNRYGLAPKVTPR